MSITRNANEDHQFGCYFYGTEGAFHLGWLDGWTFYPKKKSQQKNHVAAQINQPDYQNVKESWFDFILAIENDTLPTCDIETGHLATVMSLLAMISCSTGRSLKWDGNREILENDNEANASWQNLSRPMVIAGNGMNTYAADKSLNSCG